MEVLSFNKNMLMMIMMAMMWNIAKSLRHDVGGNKFGWVPGGNLTQWSLNEHFLVGEWLYFGYDRHSFNVLEVNQTSYEKCIDTGFIKNISTGAGRDVFQLTEAKTYYFLSGGGYCWEGVKLAVDVLDHLPPAPAPAPNGSSSISSTFQIYYSLVGAILVLIFTNFLM
ncbi:early nodulin-like protein 20 [Vicia villosa]|uniref:early nodulin-like protein 20 n=1 Tax=Vicia villosa TaxID=3911 RepID=UPI00273BDBA0|nr:early nodulin-like protein 20 [Vicia villosa]